MRGAYIDGRAQLPSSDDSYDAWDSFIQQPAGCEPMLGKGLSKNEAEVLPAPALTPWKEVEGSGGSDTWSMDMEGSSSEWRFSSGILLVSALSLSSISLKGSGGQRLRHMVDGRGGQLQ